MMRDAHVGNNAIRVNPNSFHTQLMSLSDYAALFGNQPTIGYNEFQRAYAALKMFGEEPAQRPGRPSHPYWLDDPVGKPSKKPFAAPLSGLDEPAHQLMAYLKNAAYRRDVRGRVVLFYGPASSGKTDLTLRAADALDAYLTLPEGAAHTVEFNLKGLEDCFGGLDRLRCVAHESPLNFMEDDELERMLAAANDGTEQWQALDPNTMHCPPCQYTLETFRKHGLRDLRNRIEVVSLNPLTDVTMAEFRPTGAIDYDPTQIFGGGDSFNYNRFAAFGDKEHPLVLNYGIGGVVDAPSPQGHYVVLSEFLKSPEEMINRSLDLIQGRTLRVNGRYDVPVRSVIVGTTNLEELQKLRQNELLATYVTSRTVPIEVPYLLRRGDAVSAMSRRIFAVPGQRYTVHYPPHLVDMFLGYMAVIAAHDPPQSDIKVTPLQKAQLYNGEMPDDFSGDVDRTLRELRRLAGDKPLHERTEGIRQGMPFRMFENAPVAIETALASVPSKLRESALDARYPDGCAGLLPLKDLFTSVVARADDLTEATRQRLMDEILPIAYQQYRAAQVRDVQRLMLGDDGIINVMAKYLSQVYADFMGTKEYYYQGFRQTVDPTFLEEFEREANVGNATDFRKGLATTINHRKPDYRKGSDGSIDMDQLAKALMTENHKVRDAAEHWATKRVLAGKFEDISLAFSNANEPIIRQLIDSGYCSGCAPAALTYASESRKVASPTK